MPTRLKFNQSIAGPDRSFQKDQEAVWEDDADAQRLIARGIASHASEPLTRDEIGRVARDAATKAVREHGGTENASMSPPDPRGGSKSGKPPTTK